MGNKYFVYILASDKNGTLYIGVTNSLYRRSLEHKFKNNNNSFSAKYNVNKLVYFEIYQNIEEAIAREKNLKKWNREWKLKLIEKDNFQWNDLFQD